MSTIEFVLELDQVGPLGNGARMWLDTSRDDFLSPGEEVALATLDGKIWLGRRQVSGPTTGMQFLVKFIAPIGTKWSFSAAMDNSILFQIKDQTTLVQREFLAARLS